MVERSLSADECFSEGRDEGFLSRPYRWFPDIRGWRPMVRDEQARSSIYQVIATYFRSFQQSAA